MLVDTVLRFFDFYSKASHGALKLFNNNNNKSKPPPKKL